LHVLEVCTNIVVQDFKKFNLCLAFLFGQDLKHEQKRRPYYWWWS